MLYITLPSHQLRPLSFYLAMEEYVARHDCGGGEDLFFMWQVSPSVIFGRNQLIENEVNLDYCRQHGISMYRRKSGGGCVYADEGNVMFSYVTRCEQVQFTFHRYVSLVCLVLRELGINAEVSGRNDILVDGRKVSGNAFFRLPQASIVHGTMLYDTSMDHMVSAITPSGTKLQSKGIESVRSRIGLLKDYTELSLSDFMAFVRRRLCRDEWKLTPSDVASIQTLEQTYLAPSFIYGRNPAYTMVRRGRIEGVGELEVRLEMRNGIIRDANLLGDFFLLGDLDASLLSPLIGSSLTKDSLQAVLPLHTEEIIAGLHRDDFIALLLTPSSQ